MCFSAEASLVSGGGLVIAGLAAVATSIRRERRWLPLALFPLAFGVQQLAEGSLWGQVGTWTETLRLQGGPTTLSAMVFLFFSHFFWPAWTPFAIRSTEVSPRRRALQMVCLVGGIVLGLVLYVPLWFHPEWVSPRVVQHSLCYPQQVALTGHLPFTSIPVAQSWYLLVVLVPLFTSSLWEMKVYGGLVLLSFVATKWIWAHAYISVWCFSAGLLSLYVLWVIRRPLA